MTLDALELEPLGFLPLGGGGGDGGGDAGGDASGDGGGGGGAGTGDDYSGFGGFGDYGSGPTGYGAAAFGDTSGFNTGNYGTAADNYGGTGPGPGGSSGGSSGGGTYSRTPEDPVAASQRAARAEQVAQGYRTSIDGNLTTAGRAALGAPSSAPPSGTEIAGGRSAGRGGPTAAAVDAMNTIGVHNATEQGFANALGKAAQTGLSGKVAGGMLGMLGAMTPGVTGTAIGIAGRATPNAQGERGNFGLTTHGATWGDVFSQSVPSGVNAMAQSLGIAPEAVAEGLAAANDSMMAQHNEIVGDPNDAIGDPDDYQSGGRHDPNRFMPKTGLAASGGSGPAAPAAPAAPASPKTVGGLYTPPVPDYVKRYASGAWGGPQG